MAPAERRRGAEWRAAGGRVHVEAIGLRSVKICRFDRSLVTIPNADFAQRHILNLSTCDRFLLTTTLGLRYETTDDQLRFLLAELRELLHAHPNTLHTIEDPVWARFVGFGDYLLNGGEEPFSGPFLRLVSQPVPQHIRATPHSSGYPPHDTKRPFPSRFGFRITPVRKAKP